MTWRKLHYMQLEEHSSEIIHEDSNMMLFHDSISISTLLPAQSNRGGKGGGKSPFLVTRVFPVSSSVHKPSKIDK